MEGMNCQAGLDIERAQIVQGSTRWTREVKPLICKGLSCIIFLHLGQERGIPFICF